MRTSVLFIILIGVAFSGCQAVESQGGGTSTLDASLAQSRVSANAPETSPGEPQQDFDQEIAQV